MLGWMRFVCKTVLNNFREIRSLRKRTVSLPDTGRKNVLLIISHLGHGGAQRVMCNLAAELADVCNVYLLYTLDRFPCYTVDQRVKVFKLPRIRYDPFHVFAASYLRAFKSKYRIDVSLSFLYQMNLLNVLSKGKERVIVSERNNPKLAFPEEYRGTKWIYPLADHVIFQTEEVRSLYSQRVRSHSSILPNPVSVTCPARDERKPRIVNAARLHINKNQQMLIRAFASFLPAHPDYTLSIYGGGDQEEALKRTVRELGLEGKVIFHGSVPDIHEQIADAGMFVLSSNVEGMPNALLEAMMMGLPCISTACTGAKEVIRDGVNGLLTAPGDTEGLAKAMARMADHPEEAESMRKNAMETAGAFQTKRVMSQWKDLILG